MKSVIISALAYIIVLAACQKNVATITPAEAIEGSYTAYKYEGVAADTATSYPINGKTITMQIDAIGEDSVRIQMRSVQNGFFSPGDTVIDRHVLVQKILLAYNAYRILLGDPGDSLTAGNSIEFDNSFDRFFNVYPYNGYYGYYVYTTPGYPQFAVETLFKKIQ
jgi:hypothetical protein